MYVHRLKKYIGAYIAAMEGIDALVFTDDVGVQSAAIREKVCENMQWCGIDLDINVNRTIDAGKDAFVHSKNSRVYIMAIPTAEELVICREGLKLYTGGEMA